MLNNPVTGPLYQLSGVNKSFAISLAELESLF